MDRRSRRRRLTHQGAVVDVARGALKAPHLRVDTPKPSTPAAVAAAVATIVRAHDCAGPIGVTFPGVIQGGLVRTAANLDPSWVGVDPIALMQNEIDGRPVVVLNDADAAGMAEARHGAARDEPGLVLLLTFGTGIGSALLVGGELVPNTELGHLIVDGRVAEHTASAAARERAGLSWTQWAEPANRYLAAIEAVLWPDLMIVGGGISHEAAQWLPLLTTRTRVVPAALRNDAGIVGAAMAARSSLLEGISGAG